MANYKLTPEQVPIAQAWLHDVFCLGGLIKNPVRAIPQKNYRYFYGDRNYYKERDLPYAKLICEAIRNRPVDVQKFLAYDEALEKLSNSWFNPSLKNTNYYEGTRKKPDMLARYIAWFCNNKSYLWGNKYATPQEMDQIKQTNLGAALWALNCFEIQPEETPARTRKTVVDDDGNTVQAAPQNGFKSRGPLSSVAVDLISTPGQKEQLSGKVYCILGQDANGAWLEDCAYIRPVEADQKTQSKYMVGATNKVLFGSAKGYGFCPCYFDNLQDANDFLNKIDLSKFKVNAKVVKATVGNKNALTGGYFKIGTEFGPCYISASKLNESLKEDIKIEECGAKTLTNEEKSDLFFEKCYNEM